MHTVKRGKIVTEIHMNRRTARPGMKFTSPGAGIMEADDRQVTTVFTAQPSFHHR